MNTEKKNLNENELGGTKGKTNKSKRELGRGDPT